MANKIIEEFEYFLEKKHAKDYQGLDDDMSEDFDCWLVKLDINDIIKYADECLATQRKKIVREIGEKAIKEFDNYTPPFPGLNKLPGRYARECVADFLTRILPIEIKNWEELKTLLKKFK